MADGHYSSLSAVVQQALELLRSEAEREEIELAALQAFILERAKLPDGSRMEKGNVLYISSEDDAADTIRPRMEQMGADLKRVRVLDDFLVFDDKGQQRLRASERSNGKSGHNRSHKTSSSRVESATISSFEPPASCAVGSITKRRLRPCSKH